jgi:hypothetical protein
MSRVIPASWLVGGRIQRVICHWTGGAYLASALDREHYHVILQDDAARKQGADVKVIRGLHTAADNDNCVDDDYAAHTKGLNTGSFGLAIACMGQDVDAGKPCRPGGPYGPWPMTRLLMERQAEAAAEVCHAYGLDVTERTVLQHGEVQRVYGKPQSGKWDCLEWPFDRSLSHAAVGDAFRRKVNWYLHRLRGAR